MASISDIPLFDAADYLETPRDCADFLLDLIAEGDDDDLRRGLDAVARATGHPVGDLPRTILDHLLGDDPGRADAVRALMHRVGVGQDTSPVSSA